MNHEEVRNSLPAEIARAVRGYAWRENRLGYSRTRVFRLSMNGKPPLYLKIDPHRSKFSLVEEKRRLEWLKNRLPVPEALFYAEDETNSYFLQTEIAGVAAIDDSLKNDVPKVIRELVEGLRMIHAVPVEDCPFNTPLEKKIAAARERMRQGLVEEDDFDEERLGRSAADVFREMLAAVPEDSELVFAHGDYCVPNVILDDGRLSGFVDWADGGVADRYQDLALLSRSVRHNFGEEYGDYVFELYGIAPDREKIRFYLLLDEFF